MRILVACKKNAGRSQAAAALLRYYAGDSAVILSAGSEPADHIHPEVCRELLSRGIDISHEIPKGFDPDTVRSSDVIVTMGCGEKCPYFPGARYMDWEVADPNGKPEAEVRAIVDDIDARVRTLLGELLPALQLSPSPKGVPLE